MKYLQLSAKGPEVSRLCLGTALYGSEVNRQDAFAQMDLFYENGGTFLDTARVYADWLPGGHGASETTVGAWIRERKLRNRIVISTKGAHPDAMHMHRMSPVEVRSDLEESLTALQTDCIDIYFLHRDDPSRPAGEILTMLEGFRKEGRIKYYGCSNWTLGRMEEADRIAAECGFEGFICDQIRFGLGDLNMEAISDKTLVVMDRDIYRYHSETKRAVMGYTSSCSGWFSKKLRNSAIKPEVEAVYNNEPNRMLLEKLKIWEKEFKCDPAAIVSSYVMNQNFPAVSISSFSSLEQLKDILPAGDLVIPQKIINEIQMIKKFVL